MQIKQFRPESHKIKALIYGASGSGKTTFSGTAKNALFLSAEGGLLSIADKSVDAVVTDPPFGIGFKYNTQLKILV